MQLSSPARPGSALAVSARAAREFPCPLPLPLASLEVSATDKKERGLTPDRTRMTRSPCCQILYLRRSAAGQ